MYSPKVVNSFSADAGLSSSIVTYDHSSFVRVTESNFTSVPVHLSHGETLNEEIQSNSPGISLLLMDSRNFSEFRSASNLPYSVYPQSRLDVQNYSFSLTDNSGNESFYLVFLDPSTNTTSSALVHTTIVAKGSPHFAQAIPIAILMLGALMFGIGMISGRRNSKGIPRDPPPLVKAEALPENAISGSKPTICQYCSASLEAGSVFCPSCHRSQV